MYCISAKFDTLFSMTAFVTIFRYSYMRGMEMDYSDKIRTHIEAVCHYMIAEAESNSPFVTEIEREKAMSNLFISSPPLELLINPKQDDSETGFTEFLKRFSPTFMFGFRQEIDERFYSSLFLPPFSIYVVEDEKAVLPRHLSLIVDKVIISSIERVARIRKLADKYMHSSSGIDVSFETDDSDEIERIVKDLLSSSVLIYGDMKADLSDKSPDNQKTINAILLKAIYDKYPENVNPSDIDSAMVKVIRACDTERKKMMLSDHFYFRDTFSKPPYLWTARLIKTAWHKALEEEILEEENKE